MESLSGCSQAEGRAPNDILIPRARVNHELSVNFINECRIETSFRAAKFCSHAINIVRDAMRGVKLRFCVLSTFKTICEDMKAHVDGFMGH